MKNKIAIFFLIFANIIILAHVNVPHHHLPNQSFFITQKTAETGNRHHHPLSTDFAHDHEHNNKSDYEHCLLNQVIGLPTNAVIYSCDFCANLVYFQFVVIDKSITVYLRPTILIFSYVSYASSALGLRAPPAIL